MTPRPKQILEKFSRQNSDVWRIIQMLRAGRDNGEFQWPDWCYLPVSAALAALVPTGYPTPDQSHRAAILAGLAAWRLTQGIYRFDPQVFDALWTTPIDDAIPIDSLYHLPEWCVYIETPQLNDISGRAIHGVWVYLEFDTQLGHSEIRIICDMDDGLTTLIMHLYQTISQSIEETARYISRVMGATAPMDTIQRRLQEESELISHLLPVILYLCTEEPDITEHGSRYQPLRPQPKRIKSGMRYFDPPAPRDIEVGYRIGAALRKAQAGAEGETRPGAGSHAAKAPHIRRAHFHTYRIGAGRTDTVLRWLPPIPVNLDDIEDLVPTVHPVKSS